MKYIDAEKLIAEIERRKDIYIGHALCLKETNLIDGFDEALNIIESLQQEQPFLPSNLDEAAEKYAQKEYPDEPSCGQWGTGDYEPPVDMEYSREIAKDAFKACAEWMARQMKQEQPEVDLEKEIRSMWKKCNPTDEGMGVESTYMHIEAFDIIARHFYELGKNSK